MCTLCTGYQVKLYTQTRAHIRHRKHVYHTAVAIQNISPATFTKSINDKLSVQVAYPIVNINSNSTRLINFPLHMDGTQILTIFPSQ